MSDQQMENENQRQTSAENLPHREEIFNSDEEHGRNLGRKDGIDQEELDEAFRTFITEVKVGNVAAVRDLLTRVPGLSKEINKIDIEDRKTALFYASVLKDEDQSLEMIKTLVEHGADVAYKDGLKQTALFYLARDGKNRTIEYFVSKGCPAEDTDAYGQSPLYYAAREGREDTVKLLIQSGANVNKVDTISQTPLFYAARDGRFACCKMLLDNGANVNQIDTNNYTPLFWAKKNAKKDVVDLLLERGAINTKSGKVTQKDLDKLAKTEPREHASSSTKAAGDAEQLRKRKREKEEARLSYRLVYTDENGVSSDLSFADFEKFKQKYPDIASLLLNPEKLLENSGVGVSGGGSGGGGGGLVSAGGTGGSGGSGGSGGTDDWQKHAKRILSTLWKMKGAYLFHQPVDPVRLGIPDYPEIVKRPMDFGTIKTKLNMNEYSSCRDFVDDMNLVFSNCMDYNGSESEVGRIGIAIGNEFKNLVQSMLTPYLT